MLVSIITPSFNQGQYIEDTINSVQMQTYTKREHLIIDGASNDNTVKILENYSTHEHLKWISEKDAGQVDAIKKGLRLSNGEIICWLNSDDIYLSNSVIERVVDIFNLFSSADVVTGAGIYISKDGKWERPIIFNPTRICYQILRMKNSILQPATFLRRQVLDAIPIDDSLHYAFDWDLWIRLSCQFNILPVAEYWAGYRWWGGNKTASSPSMRTREQAEIARRYLGRKSWQYILLTIFYRSSRLIEHMPDRYHSPLKQQIRLLSRAISKISGNRVAVI